MTKQEETLNFIVDTLQERVGDDHDVDLVEDNKIHVCGEKYHFTIDLLDVVDDDYDSTCEDIRGNVIAAFTQQFSGHSIGVDDDGNVTVKGRDFNFSIHLADVGMIDKPSGDFDFDSISELDKQ